MITTLFLNRYPGALLRWVIHLNNLYQETKSPVLVHSVSSEAPTELLVWDYLFMQKV